MIYKAPKSQKVLISRLSVPICNCFHARRTTL